MVDLVVAPRKTPPAPDPSSGDGYLEYIRRLTREAEMKFPNECVYAVNERIASAARDGVWEVVLDLRTYAYPHFDPVEALLKKVDEGFVVWRGEGKPWTRRSPPEVKWDNPPWVQQFFTGIRVSWKPDDAGA